MKQKWQYGLVSQLNLSDLIWYELTISVKFIDMSYKKKECQWRNHHPLHVLHHSSGLLQFNAIVRCGFEWCNDSFGFLWRQWFSSSCSSPFIRYTSHRLHVFHCLTDSILLIFKLQESVTAQLQAKVFEPLMCLLVVNQVAHGILEWGIIQLESEIWRHSHVFLF